MNIKEAEKLAKKLIQEHCPEYDFKFTQSKVKFGFCNYQTHTIKLSIHLTLLNNKEKVKECIFHEIAHVLHKGSGHGKEWKNQMIKFGYSPKRCYSPKNIIVPEGKYIFKCPNCNHRTHFYKKVKKGYGCKICCDKYNNGGYDDKYKLIQIK